MTSDDDTPNPARSRKDVLSRIRQLSSPHDFHLALTDEERLNIERTSFNFYQFRGSRMKVPPTLYADLKRGGVDMKYLEADPTLEGMSPR